MISEDGAIIIPKWLPVVVLLVVFMVVGIIVSPRDTQGHPILLLPDVKELEDYRRSFRGWHQDFSEIGQRIRVVLTSSQADLFTVSRDAQNIYFDVTRITQEIDRTNTPPAAIPARQLLLMVGEGYLEASRALLIWVSGPTEENRESVENTLGSAETMLAELERSQWLAR